VEKGHHHKKQEQTEEHVVMVGWWPCRVSSEIHINGRRVSYLVCEDKGKAAAMGQEGEKDFKRARVVLSQGRQVVEPGYYTMSSAAAMGKDKGRHWDNPNQVTRVTDTGRNPDNSNRVTWVSSTDQRRPDQVEQFIWVRDKG
jgi:hypothetical protein